MFKLKITKAVIPAAGFGTRFLPWTKAMPKEMLPIIDKPVIQIIVEQLVEAGIKEIIMVIAPGKEEIKQHFNPVPALEEQLRYFKKEKELALIKKLDRIAKIKFIYQTSAHPYGNGTPLLLSAKYVKNQPFVYCWGDEFILAQPAVLKQLLRAFEVYQSALITTIKATKEEDYSRYGFVAGKKVAKNVTRVEKVAEKPGKINAPSDLATVSPFIFMPSIFQAIKKAEERREAGKELYYNDAIKILLGKEPFYAYEIQNFRYYDTGNKLEYLKTVVEMGLKNPEFGGEFKKFLQKASK